MREPVYRPRAAFDLESIIIYVGEVCRNPAAARQIYTSIKTEVQELCAMPTLGRPFIDDSLSRRNFRSWLVGNYRVFYTYDEDFLTVWRVIHSRQDIDDFAFIDGEHSED
ncbi:type II toxin-antitoxin system RelE/ParE family toxin [Adlercreutzia sp. R21]|uniref:type II toxin-antitoxin system RelE/ParE family toxin n=1 Tax=Adlercreutzia wanghongyangiae TaxID=3111451 RepID=UPI002DB69379|nr:type II toxin-antitoxin system RelE/ParE family toxin [Adlercreutzia sp. R21]MEC4184017.1 type II toxin-antitoxin system RelE/ParE family toxin [Adlercreutzia sp. R21]